MKRPLPVYGTHSFSKSHPLRKPFDNSKETILRIFWHYKSTTDSDNSSSLSHNMSVGRKIPIVHRSEMKGEKTLQIPPGSQSRLDPNECKQKPYLHYVSFVL